jgi:DHA1 family tetracycline resistance protein-like MFS transporter
VIRRFGELGCMMIGLGAITFTFAWYGWAPTGWLYLAVLPISSFGGLVIPGLQGLMTRCVGPSEQGQLQGANQSLQGLGNLIGPSIFGLSFAWAVDNKSLGVVGLPMFEASLICAACLALAVFAARRARAAAIAS